MMSVCRMNIDPRGITVFWNRDTVNNKKYSNAEYWGKIPGIFNYSTDILKWKCSEYIYYSQHILCPRSDQNIEKFLSLFWPRIGYIFQGTYFSEALIFLRYLFFQGGTYFSGALIFLGHLFFWGAKISRALIFLDCLPHRWDACDMMPTSLASHCHVVHVPGLTLHHIICIPSITSCASLASHHITSCASPVSHCVTSWVSHHVYHGHHIVHIMFVSHCAWGDGQENKRPGNFSAPENLAPQKF